MDSQLSAAALKTKMSGKWQNLPHNLCNYATQLMDYIQKKEYNNESDDFMTFQMLSLKLKDIYKNFAENKVLVNFLYEEELQAIYKRKLIRYRIQYLKNEFCLMLEKIIEYKKHKKMITPINLSESNEQYHNQHVSSDASQQQDSPFSKKDSLIQSKGSKKSIKTILLILTSQFKENVRKIKPIYEEIVKLTPPLVEKLESTIQKQNAQNNSQLKSSALSNENYRANQSSFVSQNSNPSFNSSNFSLSSTKSSESIENIMKSILQLAQTIKQQIREIESQTQNLEEISQIIQIMANFKKEKVSFFDGVGSLEVYWMLRFDKVSVFLQTEIQQLQKGMDIFFDKLKENIQKQNLENSSSTSSRKKKQQQQSESKQQQSEVKPNDQQEFQRKPSMGSSQQENAMEGSSSQSFDIYYTAKSLPYPRFKISEQISILEQIPEEEQGKNLYSCAQSHQINPMLNDFDSMQSHLESKNDTVNLQHSLSQNEMYSFNSNFQFITKPCDNQKSQFKSILSVSDNPKDSQTKNIPQNSQIRMPLAQTQSLFVNRGEQREFSKSLVITFDQKDNNCSPNNKFKPSNSQKTASTKSQVNPSGMSDAKNGNQAVWISDKNEIPKSALKEQYLSQGFCFCNLRHV